MSKPSAHKNLVSHVRSTFEVYGDTRSFTWLREDGRKLAEDVMSFRDLDRGAREVAAWLSSRPEADRPVILLFEPGVDFWHAFLGCLYAGVAAVPAPVPHDAKSMTRLTGMFRNADSYLVLTTSKLRDLVVAGIEELGIDRQILCVAINESPLAEADSWTMPPITPDTVAFLQYTSGSTGDPKGVVITHRNIVHNEGVIADALKVDDRASLVGWIPHFHDMGLMGTILGFYVGANLVVMSPVAFLKRPVRLIEAFSKYRATMTAAPNFAYELIAKRVLPEQVKGLDLSMMEVALNGAEPIRRRTIEAINELLGPAGFRSSAMRPGYGMAEVTLFATATPESAAFVCLDADAAALERHELARPAERAVSLVSSGIPGRGVDVRIVGPEKHDVLPDGHVGEIWLRSDSVGIGYYNRPEETQERFGAQTADGDGPYLRTGDLGLVHEQHLYVTGRLKDLIIVNGRNLYPHDIEELVAEVHPATHGARGVAVAVDAQDSERLVVIQSIRKEKLDGMELAELVSAIKVAVARSFDIAAPSVVLVGRTGIHLTTSGKVQRASMRAAFLRDELPNVLHDSIDAAVADQVRSQIQLTR